MLADLLLCVGLAAIGADGTEIDAGVDSGADDAERVLEPSAGLDKPRLFDALKNSVVELDAVAPNGELRGNGSGFVVSENGVVVTNHHVIDGVVNLEARFIDGTSARMLGVVFDDEAHDVAVIVIDRQGLTPVTLAQHAPTAPGTPVALIAAPQGLGWSWSDGEVSRYWPNGLPKEMVDEHPEIAGWKQATLQLNLPSARGASGGPIIDAKGEVVAIIHSGASGSYLQFSAPVETVRQALKDAAHRDPTGMTGTRIRNVLISVAVFGLIGLAWRFRRVLGR